MNMEGKCSIWQYLEYPEICLAEHFSNIDSKVSWEWPRQMLQSAASSRTRGKGGQPSAVRDEGKDTGFYPGSAPRRVKTYSCLIVLWMCLQWRTRRLGGELLGCMKERVSNHP